MFAIRFLAGSIFCTLLICIIASVKKIFGRRLSLKCHYHIWFLLFPSLSFAFLPDSFFIHTGLADLFSPLTAATADFPKTSASNTAAAMQQNEWMREFTQSITRTDASFLFSVFHFFAVLWCVGVIISTAVFVLGLLRMRQLTRTASEPSSDIVRLVFHCKSRLNMKFPVKIFILDNIDSPFAWGLFRCYIFLPVDIKHRLSSPEIENILLHELMHIKHRDILLNHILCIFQILYWFHPFVRSAFARARQDRELYCDYAVMETFVTDRQRLDYGYTLLHFSDRFSNRTLYTAAGIGGTKERLKERVEAVAGFQKDSAARRNRSVCAMLLIACLTFSQLPLLASFASSHDRYTPSAGSDISIEDLSAYFGEQDGCFVLRSKKDGACRIYRPENSFRRISPDSTYKVFGALHALERGIISPKDSKKSWDQTIYSIPEWNRDQDLASAMRYSVNWYFESLDQQIGADELERFYRSISYGNADISGDIKDYWKESSLKISPFEQTELLQNLYENKWNLRPESIEAVKQAILLSSGEGVSLYGKTGTGRISDRDVSGWFIGFAETEDDVYFFAANLQGEDGASGSAAAKIVLEILKDKGILTASF